VQVAVSPLSLTVLQPARDNDAVSAVPLAGVTQLVECDLAKVDVAGSNPVSRSISPKFEVRPGTLAALFLYPIIWLMLLPFRIVGIAVGGVLELVWALITLPARVIRRVA
jgi:hypothetical protein